MHLQKVIRFYTVCLIHYSVFHYIRDLSRNGVE